MLNETQLNQAVKLFAERKAALAMRRRLDAEPVALMIGSGNTIGAIELAPDYLRSIVEEVKAGFDKQIGAINAKLSEMGIEP